MEAKIEVYEDNAGEWRWRLVAANGKIVADSGEGYDTKGNALRGFERFRELAAEIVT